MVEMDARSPLSPKGTNSANELESGSVSKQSFIPAASVVYKRTSALVRSSPRTRRPATVDWLANFEAQDMKQLAAQVGQHDENLSVVGNVLRAAETSSRLDCENTRSDGGAVREPGRLEPGEEAADISSASTDPSAPVPLSDPENHNLSMEASSAMLEGKSLSEGEEKNTPEMVGAGRSFEAEAQEDAEEEEEDGNWEALPSEKEIETYAEYLGMKPKEDSEVLWIAEQAMLCPVPDGWQEGVDSEGCTYFYELETMTSCRAHPCDHDYKFLYRGLRRSVRESAVTFEAVVVMADRLGIDVATEPHLLWVARHALLAPLLPGWEEMEDEEGSYYYDRRAERATAEHPIDAFFFRLIETERMKRKELEKSDPSALAVKDEAACVMELLDEDGDVFTFDWSKAEKHEPAPSDEDPMAADSWSSLAVLPAVAKLVWKAPFAAFASLLRVWSTVVGSRVAKSSNA